MSGFIAALAMVASPLATPIEPGEAQRAVPPPVVAQDAGDVKTTPAEDLNCAMWASYRLGSLEEGAAPNVTVGLTAATTWFVGLYEGKTGKVINPALKALSNRSTAADIDALQPGCLARMAAFGERLTDFAK